MALATSESKPARNFSLERAGEAAPELDASEEDKAHYTLARFAVQNDHYAGLYRQWAKALFFLTGKHWLTWNTKQLRYELENDVPEWRQQPVTNYTYAVYRAAVAKLKKQRPKAEVVPPSGDSEDREAAKLAEAILDYLYRALKQPKELQRAIGWILTTSVAFLDIGWDPDAGETRPRQVLVEVPHPDLANHTEDVPCACDEDGEPLRRTPADDTDRALDGGNPYDLDAEPDKEAIGEAYLRTIDPLCVRTNPEAPSYEEAEEFFVARLVTKAYVEKEYGVSMEDIEAAAGRNDDPEDGGRADFDRVMSSVTAAPPDPFNAQVQSRGTSQAESMTERALEIKFYVKGCDDYPDGRHWITVGTTKVWPKLDDPEYPSGEAPVEFWPPLVAIVDTPIPGQPQGVALISQVVPLNEQMNHLDGKITEYHVMQAMGGVTWVAPEDKNIVITSEPGQVRVSHGMLNNHPPIREKLEGLPAPVYSERAVIADKLRVVAGMSDADLSQRPEGVSSGRGILALQEASDAPLMPTLMAFEEAIEEANRRLLVIVRKHYSDERTIKVRGSKGEWEFRSFKGADLRDGLDVRVQAGSSFPWSKAAQWDTKLSLIGELPGLVVDPLTGKVDREALARILDAGAAGMNFFESDEDPDLVEVQREIAMFEAFDPSDPSKSNQLPQLAIWQNQPKRLEAFYNFMKRDYSRFERWSPAAQQAFVAHMQRTAEAVDQLAGVAAGADAQQNQPPGEPAPAGVPGGAPGGSGSPGLQLVPPGGSAGRAAIPGRPGAPGSAGTQAPRLTATDFRAAGQA